MSSHWEWEKRVIEEHERDKPFAPENGQPLKFKVGDKVVYTNDYGVSFERTVVGLYQPEKINSQYACGGRYLLDTDCYWMPAKEENLS